MLSQASPSALESITGNASMIELPIVDVAEIQRCQDYDNDCRSMSIEAVCQCKDYTGVNLMGFCVELAERQKISAVRVKGE